LSSLRRGISVNMRRAPPPRISMRSLGRTRPRGSAATTNQVQPPSGPR
jgi:hypothetical protein